MGPFCSTFEESNIEGMGHWGTKLYPWSYENYKIIIPLNKHGFQTSVSDGRVNLLNVSK